MINQKPCAGYLISAVFIPLQDVTHYMVHEYFEPGASPGKIMSKKKVIDLIETSGLPVYVWEWNYEKGAFSVGKRVNCNIDYQQNKYLWINEKDPKTKNLRHLIKMDWFVQAFKETLTSK